jgi:hypothetical protein
LRKATPENSTSKSSAGRQANQGFLADRGFKPTLSVDVSAGLELYKKEKRYLHLSGDVEDLITG